MRSALTSLLACCALLGAGHAWAQAAPACDGPAGAQKVESQRFVLYYLPVPAITANKHFGLDITACPKAAVTGPIQLRVDARMPAHQHGMNYKPTVTSSGANRYKAEGLMFHMPGRWELMFELEAGGRSDKLAKTVDL
jgi:hypothetical protein